VLTEQAVNMMDSSVLEFYRSHDCITDPGAYAQYVDGLPEEIPDLATVLDGLMAHICRIRHDRPQLMKTRSQEVFIRRVNSLLATMIAMDPRPLSELREIEKRVISDCHHFALMMCAILRHRGIPARVRSGFSGYVTDSHYEDLWICEYWDSARERWIMEDPHRLEHDMPADAFYNGARAWQLCRAEPEASIRFGFGRDHRGAWVARVNLIRDFAALNGFTCVSGDGWGLAMKHDSKVTPDEFKLLDLAAELAMDDSRFIERRQLYANNPNLRMPEMVLNYDFMEAEDWRYVCWPQVP